MKQVTKSNRLGLYADVKAVLDEALAHGGGEFECLTHGLAVHWRQRAYRFRKAYAETLGPKGMSPYDALILPRIDPDSCIVVIRFQSVAGVFRPAGPPVAPIAFEDDDLLDAASALAAKIEKGEL